MMEENALDISVFVLIAGSALLAFLRGFIKESLGLGAWIIAIFATLHGFPLVEPLASEFISIPLFANLLGGGVLFLLVLTLCTWIANLISKKALEGGLGALDRSLGVLFGIFRGFLVVSALWLIMFQVFTMESLPPWASKARTRPLLSVGAQGIESLLPHSLQRSEEQRRFEDSEMQETIKAWEKKANSSIQEAPPPPSLPAYKEEDRKALERALQASEDSTDPSSDP